MKVKALVVDDDALMRSRIIDLAGNDPDIEFVGQCGDGEEAVAAILNKKPHLLFLDIQMPRLNGFEVLDILKGSLFPVVVFITAHDEHALKAFKYNTLDYLVKPFSDERFFNALKNCKEVVYRRQIPDFSKKINELLKVVRKEKNDYIKRILVKTGDRIHIVAMEEVQWMEASAYYIKLHTENATHLVRETMKAMEKKLHPNQFVRIHRSYIVNLNEINEIQKWFKGEYLVILKNGKKLNISATYKKKVFDILES